MTVLDRRCGGTASIPENCRVQSKLGENDSSSWVTASHTQRSVLCRCNRQTDAKCQNPGPIHMTLQDTLAAACRCFSRVRGVVAPNSAT